jgi:tetratricopeptide (TPR) repeat protein
VFQDGTNGRRQSKCSSQNGWSSDCTKPLGILSKVFVEGKVLASQRTTLLARILLGLASASSVCAQDLTDWRKQVRKYSEAQDWESAIRLVEQQVSRAPQDLDVKAWHARLLAWSGRLAEAEREYVAILKVSRTDPDNWMGLADVYVRQGRVQDAKRAIDAAEELDPKRADLHAARGRILRAAGQRKEAGLEFQNALRLDPTSAEAKAGLNSVRSEPKHELRWGQDSDLLNFTGDYHDEWVSLISQWTSHWGTSVSGDFYQRGGDGAGKFVGSVTRRKPKWGAVTVGAAVGHDNGVIPRSEAFFDLDHGWKASERGFVRSVEFDYTQHWYWYQSARILALNGTTTIYIPQDWTLSIGATGSRSSFSGTGAEWRPSGTARLRFPLGRWSERRLFESVFFAAGTENFAVTDQIGRFASHTYGTELRFQITSRQDLTGYAAYQQRTQDRTDTSFGLSYGIHF